MTQEEFESILIPKDTAILIVSPNTFESIKIWYDKKPTPVRVDFFTSLAGIKIEHHGYIGDSQYITMNQERQITYMKDISIKEKELDKLGDRL